MDTEETIIALRDSAIHLLETNNWINSNQLELQSLLIRMLIDNYVFIAMPADPAATISNIR